MQDLNRNYQLPVHDHKYSTQEIQDSITECRIPIIKRVPKGLSYLHGLLVGLFNCYYELLENVEVVTNREEFISQYLQCLQNEPGSLVK